MRGCTEYLHIKDSLRDGTIVPCGKGDGHLREILKDYVSLGGTAVTLEPHLKVFHGLSALEASNNTTIIRDDEYPDPDTAFDAACNALKATLEEV